jgi:PKD repeat protein/subtilisin-like proprotein convertase family protein
MGSRILRFFFGAIFCLTSPFFSNSQTFNTTSGGNIPDNIPTFFSIQVNGLPNTTSSSFGILSICCNINHPSVGQLLLTLRAPNGVSIKLSNHRGGGGKNFTNTCFKEDGTLPVQSGVAPFIGSYIPDETLNTFNNGLNPNGVWSFGAHDEVPFATGTFINATITFGPNPPATPVITFCTTTNGQGCKCPDGSQDCDLLPDVTNAEKVIQNNYYDDIGVLNIGVGTPNVGFGPLEMRGTGECYCDTVKVTDCSAPCPDGSYVKEKVVQRIYHKSGNTMTYRDTTAGFMQFHPTHGHMHLDNWSYNTLRIKGPQADPLKWPIIGTASKVSFCLINSYNCSDQLGACIINGNTINYTQVGNPGLGTITGCGRQQGIFPGYLDIYFPGYDGQSIKLDSNTMCNGWYYVVSVVDPNSKVTESNKKNNVAAVPILLNFQKNGNCCKTGFYADSTNGVAPFTVKFNDTTKPASDKWFWDFGDGTTDTTQFPSHTYTKAGSYSVSLKTRSKDTNCQDSLLRKNYINVKKSATPENPYNVNIYPNPFTTSVTVFYQLTAPTTTTISVYDILGRLVYTLIPSTSTSGINMQQLPLAKLTKGVYMCKVQIGNNIQVVKLVK